MPALNTPGSQRFTIFQDDDETPLLGTLVGALGTAVDEPTCSTNMGYLRPYMKQIVDMAEAEINFKEGSSVIGQLSVDIVDKRIVATDQSTGWFTALLSNGRNTQIIGRRILIEEQFSDNTWHVLMDGVVQSIALLDSLVTYRISVRDIRERERGRRIFISSETSIWPWGPVQGYGDLYRLISGTPSDFWVVPPSLGHRARYDAARKKFVLTDTSQRRKISREGWSTLVPYLYGELTPVYESSTTSYKRKHRHVEVRWTAWSDTYYNSSTVPPASPSRLVNMDIGDLPLFTKENIGNRLNGYQNAITGINIDPTAVFGGGAAPVDGNYYWVQVVSISRPTEDTPLYITKNFGQLLKDIYDGVYSDPGAPVIRYNAAAMTAFIEKTPMANCVITEPVDDRRRWVEENIYKPLGYAPALNEYGQVVPISYAIPAAGVTVPTLGVNEIVNAEWEHGTEEIITKVEFIYHRDFQLTNDVDGKITMGTREIRFERISTDVTIVDEHLLSYAPETIRSITPSQQGDNADAVYIAYGQDPVDELGALLAETRSKEALTRFSLGAQRISAKCLRSQSVVQSLKVGDWVILSVPWLPDYKTNLRGLSRLAQVTRIKNSDLVYRDIMLLDAGPDNSPLTNATVSSIAANNTTQMITANVTAIPAVSGRTVTVEMQYALKATTPGSTDEGRWKLMVYTNVTGAVQSVQLPVGVVAWVRYRTIAEGLRPSAWSSPTSVTFTAAKTTRQVFVNLDAETGISTVTWENVTANPGIRVYYAVQTLTATPPASLTAFYDADGTLGTFTLSSVYVPDGSVLYVQLVPYPTFSAGVCSGTAGSRTTIFQAGREATNLGLTTRARIIDSQPGYVVIRVAVADPYPQGAGTVTLSWQWFGTGVGVGFYTGTTVTPEATLSEIAGSYVEITVMRPPIATGTGRLTVTATAPGRVADSDSVDVPAVERDNVYLVTRARVTATAPTTVTVRVAVADPYPRNMVKNSGFEEDAAYWSLYNNGPESATLTTPTTSPYVGAKHARVVWTVPNTSTKGVFGSTGNVVFLPFRTYIISWYAKVANARAVGMQLAWNTAPASSSTLLNPNMGTGYQRYAFKVVMGALVDPNFFITIPNGYADAANTLDIDAVQIEESEVLTDYVPDTLVTYSSTGLGGATTPVSGKLVTPESTLTEAVGTYIDYTVTRPAFGVGAGRVNFSASVAGRVGDTDSVDIPEVDRDTTYLATRARVLSSTATTVVVRVAVADPYPQGANTVTVTWQDGATGGVTPASGGTLTPAATITEAAGTYIDYTITRPAFGVGTGRVTFTATASGRVTDSDAVDIPAQEQTSFGPTLTVKVTPSATTYEIIVTWTGTMTYRIDGADAIDGTTSPQTITVTRNTLPGPALVYVFTSVKDGQTTSAPVTVLPIPATAEPVITIGAQSADNGTDVYTYSWSVTGMPGGTTYNITYRYTTTDGLHVVTGTVTGASSGGTIAAGFDIGASPTYTMTVVAINGGVQIASKYRAGTFTT